MKIESKVYLSHINSQLMHGQTFGQRLTAWRKSRGYNQAELARALGVSSQYISLLERDLSTSAKSGKPRPSQRIVDKISRILGVPIAEVRLAAGYAPPASTAEIGDPDSWKQFIESVFYETYLAVQSSDPETKKIAHEVLGMLREKAQRKRA